MKYNIILSIFLLLVSVIVSLGFALYLDNYAYKIQGNKKCRCQHGCQHGCGIKKNNVVEGAKFNFRSTRKSLNRINRGLVGLGAGSLGYGLNQKNKDKSSSSSSLTPNDAINKYMDAEKLALEAETKANETRKSEDIIESRRLKQNADILLKSAIQIMKNAEGEAVRSAITNPTGHIYNIKNNVIIILNSVDTDSNKLSKIKNNIVIPNEPNQLGLIQKIKETIEPHENIENQNNKTSLESKILMTIRSLVS